MVEGRKALHTQMSTGEAGKVRHTAHLFNGMRCAAVLPRMMQLYHLVILCYLIRQTLPYLPEFVFTYPRPFPLSLDHCF